MSGARWQRRALWFGLFLTTVEPLSRQAGAIGVSARIGLILGLLLQLLHYFGTDVNGSRPVLRIVAFGSAATLTWLWGRADFSLLVLSLAVASAAGVFELARRLSRQGLGIAMLGLGVGLLASLRAGARPSLVVPALVSLIVGGIALSNAPNRSMLRGWASGALLAVGLWQLSGLEIGLTTLIGVAAVALLLLGLLIAVRNPFTIVLVVALALAITAPLRDAALPEGTDPVAGEPYFVVLGDSYISGEGAHTFIEGTNTKDLNDDLTNECRRSPSAWPFLMARSNVEPIPRRVLFLACSGSVTENINIKPQLRRTDDGGEQVGPRQLALYQRERKRLRLGDPNFVVVSIGGNDAGFGELAATCVGPGSCSEVGTSFFISDSRREPDLQPGEPGPGLGEPEALTWIEDDLIEAYRNIRSVFGDTPVVVAPYPDPVAVDERACQGILLDVYERAVIEKFSGILNMMIRRVAASFDFTVLTANETSLRAAGARLCDEKFGVAGINFFAVNPTGGSYLDLVNPTHWIHNSFHPNADGHRALAKSAINDLRAKELPRSVDRLEPPQTNGSRNEPDLDTWRDEQVEDLQRRLALPLTFIAAGGALGWSWILVVLAGERRRRVEFAVMSITSFLLAWPFFAV